RRLPRAAEPARHRCRRHRAGADLSRRRGGADLDRRFRQGGARLPGPAALLRARLRHADPLPHKADPCRSRRRQPGSKPMTMVEAVILTIMTASTPLLLAAIGELVTERSGVLNLGVEGMMIMGAVCAFATAQFTGSAYLGILGGLFAGA